MRRALAIAVCAACAVLAARPAMAQKSGGPVKATCQLAYKNARKLERAGQLVSAEKLLRTCAKPRCGVFLEHQCTFAYARIEADMPSVVPTAKDPDGKPVMALKLKVDGYLLASRLDGHAVTINPGVHEFTFETEAGVVARKRVMVLQGQRNRQLVVSVPRRVASAEPAPERPSAPAASAAPKEEVAAAPAPAQEPAPEQAPEPKIDLTTAAPPQQSSHPSRWFSATSIALLGVGAAGVGGYGLLTYWGRKDNDDLAQCAPSCSQSSVDHIDHLYLAADISLGVGVAALLGGAYLVWRHHANYAVEVQPAAGGAVAGVSGAF
jgi:hypothetical protein